NIGLSASTSYSYRVLAIDAANNSSGYSNTASATTPAAPDTQPPTAPSGLGATAAARHQTELAWPASTDNLPATNSLIERCQDVGSGGTSFAPLAPPAAPPICNIGLSASTSYSYRVLAIDAANNSSGYSNTASATTPAAPDTQPPTAPSGLGATAASSSQINLAWTASSGKGGVTNYLIERCQGVGCGGTSFAQVATSTTSSYSNTGLSASTSYSYRVLAIDAANNSSGYSNTASGTTPAAPDTQAPTAPSGLGATAASSSQINLAWTASTDNIGVTNYLIERCQGVGCGGTSFAQVATSTTTSYSNIGLSASTSYSYRVLAIDAANNSSGY